jgi:hypothetical protein
MPGCDDLTEQQDVSGSSDQHIIQCFNALVLDGR